MGYISIYNEQIKKLKLDLSKLDLLELGDQEIHDPALGKMFSKLRDSIVLNPRSYTVYDLHKRHGVTVFDLAETYNFDLQKFDIITNFGTTEHVEPEVGQYNCWKNIHKMLKINGMIISIVPCSDGGWEDHCRYFYNKLFFEAFEEIGYNLIVYKIIEDKNCFSVLQKKEEMDFLSEQNFWKDILIRRENNSEIIYHDNNPKALKF